VKKIVKFANIFWSYYVDRQTYNSKSVTYLAEIIKHAYLYVIIPYVLCIISPSTFWIRRRRLESRLQLNATEAYSASFAVYAVLLCFVESLVDFFSPKTSRKMITWCRVFSRVKQFYDERMIRNRRTALHKTPCWWCHTIYVIHLPPAHHSHPPPHIHCFIPGSKLTFSTIFSTIVC